MKHFLAMNHAFVAAEATRRIDCWQHGIAPPPHVGGYVMFSFSKITPLADVLDHGGKIDVRRQHFLSLRGGLEQRAAIRRHQVAR